MVEPLWRLHALHHSSEQLYVLSSGRNHPVHTALTSLLQIVPLALLGAGPEVLALHGAFTGIWRSEVSAVCTGWFRPLDST